MSPCVNRRARKSGIWLKILRSLRPLRACQRAQATEDATWSAKRDTATGYGIAVFDVDPGSNPGGQTSITVTHYHALGTDPVNPTTGTKGKPTDNYTVFETFTLVRPRSDSGSHQS